MCSLRGQEFQNLIYNTYFSSQDISGNIQVVNPKWHINVDNIHMEGAVSPIFDTGPSFGIIKCRKLSKNETSKSSRFLP